MPDEPQPPIASDPSAPPGAVPLSDPSEPQRELHPFTVHTEALAALQRLRSDAPPAGDELLALARKLADTLEHNAAQLGKAYGIAQGHTRTLAALCRAMDKPKCALDENKKPVRFWQIIVRHSVFRALRPDGKLGVSQSNGDVTLQWIEPRALIAPAHQLPRFRPPAP